MASVVIIHAAEDALPARALAEKLRQAKLEPVIEKSGDELRDALKGAPVTIALWSPRSVDQAGLADDVNFARSKSKVVHARMQNAQLPANFQNDKAVDLTGWRGEDEFPAWRELAKLVTDRAGVAPLPPPAPKPPSGFFQPGRVPAEGGAQAQAPKRPAPQQPAPQRAAPPPPPRPQPAAQQTRSTPQSAPRPAPRAYESEPATPKKGGGMMMIAIITFVVVAALGGGGYFFWQQQQGATAASSAWEDVEKNDAGAIRAFISGNPGQFKDEAETALKALEEQTFDAARDADTIEAFDGFLSDFPDSSHAMEARGRIAELRSMPATEEGVPTDATTTAVTDPDLVPPGTTPDTTGGPAQITPPPATEPTPDATTPTP